MHVVLCYLSEESEKMGVPSAVGPFRFFEEAVQYANELRAQDFHWVKISQLSKPTPSTIIPELYKYDHLNRNETIVQMYAYDNYTQAQLAEIFGMSRQGINQIIHKTDPTLAVLCGHRDKARKNLVRLAKNMKDPLIKTCPICGKVFQSTNKLVKYCCKQHQLMYVGLRYLIDDNYRDAARKATAKYNIRHGKPDVVVRHSQAILDGTSKTVGRWLIEGSEVYDNACLAYRLGWPVFEKFPEEIQQQVRDIVDKPAKV